MENYQELLIELKKGEYSKQQFKTDVTNAESLAAEMVAFSNSLGGNLIIGVNDAGGIEGLTLDRVAKVNQLISNTASQKVIPAINPITNNIQTPSGIVVVISIPKGINKPYQDNSGTFWVKNGADKRKATSREEIQRLFQNAHLLHADEISIPSTSIKDLDIKYFQRFFEREFNEPLDLNESSLENVLENMNLFSNGSLNLAGALVW